MNSTTISKAFTTLRSCGARGGPTCQEEEAVALLSWSAILGHLEDEALQTAILARLSGPRSMWWPTPGEMLALCPKPATRLLEALPDDGSASLARMARLEAFGASPMVAAYVVGWDEFEPPDANWACARDEFLRPYRELLRLETNR